MAWPHRQSVQEVADSVDNAAQGPRFLSYFPDFRAIFPGLMGKLPAASAELRQELRQELLDLGFDAVRAKAS